LAQLTAALQEAEQELQLSEEILLAEDRLRAAEGEQEQQRLQGQQLQQLLREEMLLAVDSRRKSKAPSRAIVSLLPGEYAAQAVQHDHQQQLRDELQVRKGSLLRLP